MKKTILLTHGVSNSLQNKEIYEFDLQLQLFKFLNNNWGDLCQEDTELQNSLIKEVNAKLNHRFIGIYKLMKNIEIWIMSEYDYTIDTLIITVLFPHEY
ncbi:hypothetical protein ACSW8Q_04140 [Clostridium perfringens]|uniref:hypothetical protein n=1 Tax=Clostridium perfringens TaxID=1502 RepID=UPI000D70C875|nr:hypothetical protein [Clostridium perfringens]MBO3403926.1 hypothetical protein [Clostridium perfringens]MDM0997279.1 hypothetical protein [Clostridium perfringens]PWW84792.1 hypothetical protein CYK81_12040 [Clostridium perfringens]WVM76668.1 hypothetical protein V1680_03685 [Clostridium perfringens]HAT4218255.1 hypothetical protein [Clostridium perfringens]